MSKSRKYDYDYDYEEPQAIATNLIKAARGQYHLSLSSYVHDLTETDGALSRGILSQNSEGRHPLHVAAESKDFQSVIDSLQRENNSRKDGVFAKALVIREHNGLSDSNGDTVFHVAPKYQDSSTLGKLFTSYRCVTQPHFLLKEAFEVGSKGVTVLDLTIQHQPGALGELVRNICYVNEYDSKCIPSQKSFFDKLFAHYPQGNIPVPLLVALFLELAFGYELRHKLVLHAHLPSVEAALEIVKRKNEYINFDNDLTARRARQEEKAKQDEINRQEREAETAKRKRSDVCPGLINAIVRLFNCPSTRPKNQAAQNINTQEVKRQIASDSSSRAKLS